VEALFCLSSGRPASSDDLLSCILHGQFKTAEGFIQERMVAKTVPFLATMSQCHFSPIGLVQEKREWWFSCLCQLHKQTLQRENRRWPRVITTCWMFDISWLLKPWYNCDSTAIRYDYDPTTTYRARLLPFNAIRPSKKLTSIFRRSRVVVVSQSNRNCDIGLSSANCRWQWQNQRQTAGRTASLSARLL